jgi:hypothetical protein
VRIEDAEPSPRGLRSAQGYLPVPIGLRAGLKDQYRVLASAPRKCRLAESRAATLPAGQDRNAVDVQGGARAGAVIVVASSNGPGDRRREDGRDDLDGVPAKAPLAVGDHDWERLLI